MSTKKKKNKKNRLPKFRAASRPIKWENVIRNFRPLRGQLNENFCVLSNRLSGQSNERPIKWECTVFGLGVGRRPLYLDFGFYPRNFHCILSKKYSKTLEFLRPQTLEKGSGRSRFGTLCTKLRSASISLAPMPQGVQWLREPPQGPEGCAGWST